MQINYDLIFKNIPDWFKPYYQTDRHLWMLLEESNDRDIGIKYIINRIVEENPNKYKKISKNVFNKKGDVFVDGELIEESNFYTIHGPALIGKSCTIRSGAFIRGNVIIGNKCMIGNSTEIKNAILFDNVQVPHYNYVGDSILGYKAHLGAGVKLSNVRLNEEEIVIKLPDGSIEKTGRLKFGSLIGDNAQIGCNSVLNPGTILVCLSFLYCHLVI
ncbi:hypothetical protein AGMMS49579_24610 [Spirochaetia bacterium]|nr:hypothetical protein AGMMS49579_24610 [Spirochaetia bacterium]